jgi:hypothetical protein
MKSQVHRTETEDMFALNRKLLDEISQLQLKMVEVLRDNFQLRSQVDSLLSEPNESHRGTRTKSKKSHHAKNVKVQTDHEIAPRISDRTLDPSPRSKNMKIQVHIPSNGSSTPSEHPTKNIKIQVDMPRLVHRDLGSDFDSETGFEQNPIYHHRESKLDVSTSDLTRCVEEMQNLVQKVIGEPERMIIIEESIPRHPGAPAPLVKSPFMTRVTPQTVSSNSRLPAFKWQGYVDAIRGARLSSADKERLFASDSKDLALPEEHEKRKAAISQRLSGITSHIILQGGEQSPAPAISTKTSRLAYYADMLASPEPADPLRLNGSPSNQRRLSDPQEPMSLRKASSLLSKEAKAALERFAPEQVLDNTNSSASGSLFRRSGLLVFDESSRDQHNKGQSGTSMAGAADSAGRMTVSQNQTSKTDELQASANFPFPSTNQAQGGEETVGKIPTIAPVDGPQVSERRFGSNDDVQKSLFRRSGLLDFDENKIENKPVSSGQDESTSVRQTSSKLRDVPAELLPEFHSGDEARN